MNINFYLVIAAAVVFLVPTAMAAVDSMHFFQLNSYRFDTHTKWMKENTRKYLTHITFSMLMLIALLFDVGIKFKAISLIVLLIAAIPAEKPKKAKKPLVYTPRVKRMLFTEILFSGLLLGLVSIPAFSGAQKHETYFLITLALIYSFAPALCLVSNFINKPVELSVNRYYTNDAKRILKSCPNLRIIGITGSYGKTSVKYYLTTLLKTKYNVLMTPESYNTPMGVVKTIRGSLKATDEIFVCEMGAKWVGDIKELCDIVHPHHGVITS
ncbi:MAG: UDP-N-acetylmuramoyl-tripeptide--D-alanyl-D-alanine ligase, partial [Clostridia bacterium]|nr:UDP-N-acetylmuramoyl-tripeptide--D-alanyl-D-alanine ligase [Clostridia bacterium]